jgi:ribosomal protein L11 methyltransferase
LVEPVAELFRRYGKGGVAIEEPGGYDPDIGQPRPPATNALLRTYMPVSPGFRSNRELVHIGIKLIARIHPLPDLQERELLEEEWESAWKAHFTLLKLGRRLVVRAPWQEHEPQSDEVVVVMEPGLAFGTGHHPTTRRCLENLERLAYPGCRVLDVGAGSGILSVTAAKLGAGWVRGLEIDPVALRVCRANLRSNGVSGLARCYGGTLPHAQVPDACADLVLANINSVALAALAPRFRTALRSGGWLVAAGILEERRAQVETAFAKAGLKVQEALLDDDWVALLAQ